MAFEIHEHAFSDCMQIGAEVAWLAACHTESFRDRPHGHGRSAHTVRRDQSFPQTHRVKLFDVGREAEATAAAADN